VKILVIAPHPFYVDRGTPIDVDLLVRALSDLGHDVDLACYGEGEAREYERVEIHRAHDVAWLRNGRPGFSVRKLVADALLLPVVLRRVRAEKYDVVHVGEEAVFFAFVLKRLFKLPYVYDMDSSIAQQLVEQLPWLRPMAGLFNRMESRVLRSSLAAAPVCNALGDLAEQRGAPHVEVLHDISQLGDPDAETRGVFLREWGITSPVLLYVGNLQPYQGVDLLLEAFALAVEQGSGLDLVVAGGHPGDIASYRRRSAELGVEERTHFVGPWPAGRLGELLIDAEIVTAPRIKGLNTPMKVFPYMHSGRPLLATALPTHTQLLDSEVAMLAEPVPEAFAEGILRLEKDAELRRSLGAAGRRFVEENHTFEAHRRRVDRLYRYVDSRLSRDPSVLSSQAKGVS
jgi:glycosyltransferase involved in cell wall biosynthesis